MGEFLVPLLYVAGGVILLLLAGDRLVRHAAHLATSYRVPKTVVGALIVGFGTSLPELCVSMTAALRGSPGIAVGNVAGSNAANVGLILGLTALLGTLAVKRRILRVDLRLGVVAALGLLLWIGPDGRVSRLAGGVMVGVFLLYLWNALHYSSGQRAGAIVPEDHERRTGSDITWIVLGLVGLAGGATLLVDGATGVARLLGVGERVIAVSLVAVGTSLPELAATFAAVRRREGDIAMGNVAGSNLFNVLFVLGSTALVRPVPVEPALAQRDFPAVLVFSLLAFPFLSRSRRLGRIHGGVLLAVYAAYIAWTWSARA